MSLPRPPERRAATRPARRVRNQPPLPCLLLTGFEPFGGQSLNPAWEAARRLDGAMLAGARVVAVQLPCVFGQSLKALDAALRKYRPEVVIAVGQAGGRASISVERIAINVDDACGPDNAGQQPVDMPVDRKGPAAYFSTLPVKAIVAALQAAGIAAEVSQTAGTFVCNHVFYGLMQRQARYGIRRCGFIHLPYLPEQAARQPAGTPGMAPAVSAQALRLALQATLNADAP